jgi:hypothetical protein
MVGGPTGVDFPEAILVYEYTPLGYAPTPTRTFSGCTGYWAHFVSVTASHVTPTALVGGTTPPGTTASCPLWAGWNLVGNPFRNVAQLPSGMTGFYWDATSEQYQATPLNPIAGSVWVYVGAPSSLLLTVAQAVHRSRRTQGRP